MIADAWQQITQKNFQVGGDRILKETDSLFQELPKFKECDCEDATKWITGIQGFKFRLIMRFW